VTVKAAPGVSSAIVQIDLTCGGGA
jgi:hypothetical protein